MSSSTDSDTESDDNIISKDHEQEEENNEACTGKDARISDAEDTPAWLRYLPRPPWNGAKVHHNNSSHIDIEEGDKQHRCIVKTIPQSSNPFATHELLISARKRNRDDAQETSEQLETNTPSSGMDSKDDTDSFQRKRKCKYGSSRGSLDEAAALISFCKLSKEIS